MNERVKILRENSLNARPFISIERAKIVTDTYKEYFGKISTPVLRALTFKALMEERAICINEKELIVGERGEKPKGTPTYPELCCHTLEDLKMINDREKISFDVSEEVMKTQREQIIPYWKGISIRDRILNKCHKSGKIAMKRVFLLNLWNRELQDILQLMGKYMKKAF